jgi:alkylresorcinol/alkylpyrone synthase
LTWRAGDFAGYNLVEYGRETGGVSESRPVPRLCAIATALPEHRIEQDAFKRFGARVFGPLGETFERMSEVYDNAGIAARHAAAPLEWLTENPGWAVRQNRFCDVALALLETAAERCLDRAGLTPADVDGIVAVSTTGVATPSLDARLMERMPFRRDVQRLPVFGLGCGGGVQGLARAAALARATPGQRWLLLVVELCTLTFRPNDISKSNIVATALFGDGAAAALVSCDGDGPAVTAWGEHTWPGSLDVMGWRIEDDGFGVLFSRDIPYLVGRDLAPALDGFLRGHGLARGDIDDWLLHPGGAKVLDALEGMLGLGQGGLRHARAVLREYGNMSAPTALFVVERALSRGATGRLLTGALGPGFTAGFVVLDAS